MALLDPIVIFAFACGLGLAYVIGRIVREVLRRRREAKFVAGPDTRSRQVKRAQRRRRKKADRY